MLQLTKDRALALVFLLVTSVMWFETRNIPPPSSWQTHGSALFPRILLGAIGLLSVIILIRSLIQGAPERTTPRRRFGEWLAHHQMVLSLFGLFGAYALLLPHLGYMITTLAFMISSLALLLGVDHWRKWAINLGVSFTLVPSVYVIFRYGLQVWLP